MEGQNSPREVETDPKLRTSTGYQLPPDSVRTNLEETSGSCSYSNFSPWRKNTILFIVSWMTLAATFSSTSLLPAIPEITLEFSTTTEAINISNAGVIIAMGSSSLIWGPISGIIGRRNAYNAAIFVLCICSVGAAAAPDFRTFTSMRVLGGFTGTFFMIAGQTILADIFEPKVRGTAVGFFMAGSVSGPAIGPCVGGVIVTFTKWRVIYWVQVGMVGFGLALSFLFIPDIKKANENGQDEDNNIEIDNRRSLSTPEILAKFDPRGIFRLLMYPNILFADLTCGFLAFYQYALLTSVPSIINPRFHLTTPLVSGLFYLAPGAGFLFGSIVGGRLSDRTVKRYIVKRNGVRLPRDRLNSGLLTLFFVLPAATLVYGWTLQKEVGGVAVPIISAFWGGAGLMGSFNALNTYTAGNTNANQRIDEEVLPWSRPEVIGGKYIIQYLFAAGSTAAVVPLISSIGVGLTFTISY
ncbi:hypothetical protein VE01_01648 [Pseudogymnoascus verrucosus]|uniref:Major facilitator superfamily (MFS) profile domain-containing protein n=1 Tax=Pseudogymnoascus verrucosus TaxID=342668 RepID=A0A1B8GX19_9PEZI|nr:uncharacterized protein VE01_01648 [Pseudogymnoascus verrucosus]OBU00378.1 hypothetical protein VE01_01648 [Pseudogymnoascus verrucosus]